MEKTLDIGLVSSATLLFHDASVSHLFESANVKRKNAFSNC